MATSARMMVEFCTCRAVAAGRAPAPRSRSSMGVDAPDGAGLVVPGRSGPAWVGPQATEPSAYDRNPRQLLSAPCIGPGSNHQMAVKSSPSRNLRAC